MARATQAGLRRVARRVGELVRTRLAWVLLVLGAAAAVVVRPLTAQLPDAEAAFKRGDYRAARAAYERVLAGDSTHVRALYQLAILDSWDGKLVRSLDRFARLRRLAPHDGDIMVAQARVLAWANRTAAAGALYDSVLARAPDRTDALAGRARTVAWSGDLDRAESLWRAALARHADDSELLIGLAQTLYWKGQPALAEGYAARARVLAPQDRTVLELERELRAAVRPVCARRSTARAIPTATRSWRRRRTTRRRSARRCGARYERVGVVRPWARSPERATVRGVSSRPRSARRPRCRQAWAYGGSSRTSAGRPRP